MGEGHPPDLQHNMAGRRVLTPGRCAADIAREPSLGEETLRWLTVLEGAVGQRTGGHPHPHRRVAGQLAFLGALSIVAVHGSLGDIRRAPPGAKPDWPQAAGSEDKP